MLRCGVLAGVSLCALALFADPQPPATQPALDEALWSTILALRNAPPPATQSAEPFEELAATRTALLERLRLYLTLYPGSEHRDEAIQLELATLFELGALNEGDLQPLCNRVSDYMRKALSDAARAEAAYWEITCRRWRAGRAATQPSSAPAVEADAEEFAAICEYVRAYPRSRHTPRLALQACEAAQQRSAVAEMREMVELLEREYPGHMFAESARGQFERFQTIGRPFSFSLTAIDGSVHSENDSRGRLLLIVVWGADEASRACIAQVQALRRERGVLTIGVSVDATVEQTRAIAAELNIDWPLVNDGLGRANAFVRKWGIREIPAVFVIDATGKLTYAGGCDGAALRRAAGGQ